jgi:hypothetical protein
MRKHLNIAFRGILLIIFGLIFIGLGANASEALSLAMVPPLSFGDLVINDGDDNMGGTQLIAYYALDSEVASLPAMIDSPATLEDYGQVVGAFVMNGTAKFKRLYASPNTGKVDDSKIEGNDANGFESTYEFFFPTTSPASLGFQRVAATSKFVVVVIENNGQKRILGSKKGMPALIGSVASSTDVNSGGAHGTTFSFKSYQNGPAPSYSGVIPTAESLPTGV